jgi:hypothetical protein
MVLESGVKAPGGSWPAVLQALSEAHHKLTRQEIHQETLATTSCI